MSLTGDSKRAMSPPINPGIPKPSAGEEHHAPTTRPKEQQWDSDFGELN